MPATSSNQKTLMCIALSIKKGKTSPSYSKEAARLAQTMSEKQLADYCGAPVEK